MTNTLTFSQPDRRVRALYNGHLIADTGRPVIAHQSGLPDVVYFPREDVEMSVLRASGTGTLPGQEHATLYTVFRDGVFAEGGAWSFESADIMAAELSHMIAFAPEAVTLEVYEEKSDDMWRKEQADMSNYIRHTDSGSGLSQAGTWKPTVANPDDAERNLGPPPGTLS